MAAGMIAVAGTPIGLMYGANAGWMFEAVALNTGETWNEAAGNPHYWWVWLLALLGIFFVPLALLIIFYFFYALFSFRFWELSAEVTKHMFFYLYYLFVPYRMK